MTVSNDMVRLTTTITKDLDIKMQQSMRVNGYNSKSNFIRSAVEEKLKNNIDDGSDTTFVSKHVVANQYRLLNEKFDQKINELEKTIDEKNKQVELLTGIISTALFSQSRFFKGRIDENTLNKLATEISEVINSDEGVTVSSITNFMKKIMEQDWPVTESLKAADMNRIKNDGPIVGTYDFFMGGDHSKDDEDEKAEEATYDEENDDDENIVYSVSVDNFQPEKIKIPALKDPAKELSNISNLKKRGELTREAVLHETAKQNPMGKKIVEFDPDLNDRSEEDQKMFEEFRTLYFACLNDVEYQTGFLTDDTCMMDRYKPLKDLHGKIMKKLDMWCDAEGHFIDATRRNNLRNF